MVALKADLTGTETEPVFPSSVGRFPPSVRVKHELLLKNVGGKIPPQSLGVLVTLKMKQIKFVSLFLKTRI